MDDISYFIGGLIGGFIYMFILSHIIRWVLKKFTPKIKGNARVGLSVGAPFILALFLNPAMILGYTLGALAVGYVFYQQEIKKTV